MDDEKARVELRKRVSAAGSMRKLVRQEGWKHVSHGNLSDFLKGKNIEDPDKRRELGLPVVALAEVCPQCGVVHVKVCKEPFADRMKRIGHPEIAWLYNLLKERNPE